MRRHSSSREKASRSAAAGGSSASSAGSSSSVGASSRCSGKFQRQGSCKDGSQGTSGSPCAPPRVRGASEARPPPLERRVHRMCQDTCSRLCILSILMYPECIM